MAYSSFEDLEVWKRGCRIAVKIYGILKDGKIPTVTGVRPKFLRFGELDVKENQAVTFSEKPRYTGNYVNGGFFVFNRAIFNYLEDRDDCDLEVGPLDQISQQGELMVYKHDRFWACMDTIRDTEHLNNLCVDFHIKWTYIS